MLDAHAHLISADRDRYPPAPPGGTVDPADFQNPMTLERLLAAMDATGVEQALLVQRGSIYGFDCSYVTDCAARHPDRLRAVCSIDATSPTAAEDVAYWTRERGGAGIRLMELIKGSDIGWLDSPAARNVWQQSASLDVPVCVHFFPWNRAEGLKKLAAIMADIPGLTVVVDHLAAIRSDAGPPDHGVDELLEGIARFEGANLKFTTIPLGPLETAGIDTRPIIARVANLFGAERMMWGSDITQSKGTYEHMVALGCRAVSGLPAAQQDLLLGGTAQRVYEMT